MPPRSGIERTTDTGPVWAGPCDPGRQGGVTVSLLQKFLGCRDRFRAYAIEGWKAAPAFNHKIFYGSMWHAAEEVFAATGDPESAVYDGALEYAEGQADVYPVNRDDIQKWWNVLRMQFPEYVKFWASQPPTATHTPLLQEQVFDVPYALPSGRKVRLRGRWDGMTRRDSDGSVWMFETKTKGDVDALAVEKQLRFDLQTMTYLVALNGAKFHRLYDLTPDRDTGGVRYNVVRRPLSGGKGTIVRHKPTKSNPAGESETDYYKRLGEYIKSEPATYFFRWTVDVSVGDVQVFRQKFLDPCLEFLCAWYDIQRGIHFPTERWDSLRYAFNWRTPFGLTQTIADGFGSDLDHLLDTGSTVGLVRTGNLFPEL